MHPGSANVRVRILEDSYKSAIDCPGSTRRQAPQDQPQAQAGGVPGVGRAPAGDLGDAPKPV